MKTKALSLGALAACAALALTACGGNTVSEEDIKSGKIEGRGPITYVQGKDNSGKLAPMLEDWNKAHPKERVTMIELSSEADQQRNSMVQNAQTKSDSFCVLSLDNVWMAEFAAYRWILPLPENQFPKEKILPPVWQTGMYRGQLFAMPHGSDGGILFYRKDLLQKAGITKAPKTWDDMKKGCNAVRALPGHKDIGCYAGQFAKYEGLTVNADEAIHAFGGQTVDKDGKAKVNSPEAKKGLKVIADGFKSGFIPKESLTYKEEEGRNAFESERVLYYRNWPYQYALSKEKLGDKMGVAPMPGFTADKPEGGTSSLGGHNAAISSYCKNRATALDFIKWYTSEPIQKRLLTETTLAPIYTSLYDDPSLIKQFPYLPSLKKSIESAVPRPQVYNYGDVSTTIQDAVFPVLKGETETGPALDGLAKKLTKMTSGK